MATLLVAALPFAVASYGVRRRGMHASAGRIVMLAGAMLVLVIGILLNRSLAGLGLAVPILAASLLIREPIERRRTRWGLAAVAALAALAVVAVLAGPLANNLTAVGADKEYSSRYTSFANSLHAARDHFPVGSGLGSFADLYPRFENPDIVDAWFVNHVHNDFIELALETGLAGMLLMVAFLSWWGTRTVAIWRAPIVDPFARAATLASGAMLAHSMVEFPLRATALAALFAACIALMAGARRRDQAAKFGAVGDEAAPRARHLSVG
jgi:O-antigen ligase